MRVTVLRLGLAIHAMESSWMATPVAPEPAGRANAKSDRGHRSRHPDRKKLTPAESAGPSGTTNTLPRPAIVVGLPPPPGHVRVETVKSVAEMIDRVRSTEFTTPITCP